MEKLFEKVTHDKQTGYKVVITSKSRYSSIESPYETMYIDMNGDVMYIDHDSSDSAGGGFCYYTKDKPDFWRHVRSFMEKLLEQNVDEFKKMRDVLTGEWLEMAETIRKDAVSKFDF